MRRIASHLAVGLVATALRIRAKRLQDDPRTHAQLNSRKLKRLSEVYLAGEYQEGSLELPPLSLPAQVEAVELIWNALLAECERHRAEGRDEVAENLCGALNSVLEANPVAGSFVVSQDEWEDLSYGHLARADGRTLHEVEDERQLEELGLAAVG
jgi:hypothetical protein